MTRHHEIREVEGLSLDAIANQLPVAVADRLDRNSESPQLILVALERAKDALALRVREIVAGNVLRELLERRVPLADEQRGQEVHPPLEFLLARGEATIR